MNCTFCWRHCSIPDGQFGFCGCRRNEGGEIRSPNYGRLVSLALDPIEKKPLYHFLPGSVILSLAESGCNYRCLFCQNHMISQPESFVQGEYYAPQQVLSIAGSTKARSISFTYSEPTVWQDYLSDVATLAKRRGLFTVMVTNGSFSRESWDRIFSSIDAFNIDVKGDAAFYQEICKGNLDVVLDNVKEVVRRGKHLEVTTLLIEGIHTKAMVQDLGSTLADLGVQVWHLSRFFPRYRMSDRKETGEAFLTSMLEVAEKSGIPFLYGGNSVHQDQTICPSCHHTLIHSHRYGGNQRKEAAKSIIHGRCAFCDAPVYGVFDEDTADRRF